MRSTSRLRICAWIETSSALTASSAISSSGCGREAARDRDPLALTAAQLAREAARDLRREADEVEQLARPWPARRPASRCPCTSSGSAIAAPTVSRGFSELNGSWKTTCIRRRIRCRLFAGERAEVDAVEEDRALVRLDRGA